MCEQGGSTADLQCMHKGHLLAFSLNNARFVHGIGYLRADDETLCAAHLLAPRLNSSCPASLVPPHHDDDVRGKLNMLLLTIQISSNPLSTRLGRVTNWEAF